MDDLYARVLDVLNGQFPLEPVPVAPELAVTTFPLKALEMRLFNWRARGIRKIYCMRLTVRVPALAYGALYHSQFASPVFCPVYLKDKIGEPSSKTRMNPAGSKKVRRVMRIR